MHVSHPLCITKQMGGIYLEVCDGWCETWLFQLVICSLASYTGRIDLSALTCWADKCHRSKFGAQMNINNIVLLRLVGGRESHLPCWTSRMEVINLSKIDRWHPKQILPCAYVNVVRRLHIWHEWDLNSSLSWVDGHIYLHMLSSWCLGGLVHCTFLQVYWCRHSTTSWVLC